jgi:hypothetical protein
MLQLLSTGGGGQGFVVCVGMLVEVQSAVALLVWFLQALAGRCWTVQQLRWLAANQCMPVHASACTSGLLLVVVMTANLCS